MRQNVNQIERVVSVVAGAALSGLAWKQRKPFGAAAATGAWLVARGASGYCPVNHAIGRGQESGDTREVLGGARGSRLHASIMINRPAADLYRFWRRLENLPTVMRHLKDVRSIDSQHSRWVAEGALGKDLQWDAELINEREDEMLAWASLPGGDLETAGSVHFRPLNDGENTEVVILLKYNPPAGKVGARIADLLGDGLAKKLDEDLETFKEVMETGMAPAPSVG